MDELKLWVVIAQIINFWILFFIFKHFLWKKIIEAIDSRREYLVLSENAEKEAWKKIEEAKSNAEDILKKAREKALEIERSAEHISKQNASYIINQAEKDADYILKRTEEDLEMSRISMINSMKTKIVDLSLKLNQKLFKNERVDKDYMNDELEKILM